MSTKARKPKKAVEESTPVDTAIDAVLVTRLADGSFTFKNSGDIRQTEIPTILRLAAKAFDNLIG